MNHFFLSLLVLQVKDDGSSGDLLVRQARNDKATIQATDSYAQRISIDDHYSLHITNAALTDQRTFTCMVVSESNLMEYSVSVTIKSEFTVFILIDSFKWLTLGSTRYLHVMICDRLHLRHTGT